MRNFKNGYKVIHKLIGFDLVIIGKCNPLKLNDIEQVNNGASYLKCRYYNPNTNKWEEHCFFDYELISE